MVERKTNINKSLDELLNEDKQSKRPIRSRDNREVKGSGRVKDRSRSGGGNERRRVGNQSTAN